MTLRGQALPESPRLPPEPVGSSVESLRTGKPLDLATVAHRATRPCLSPDARRKSPETTYREWREAGRQGREEDQTLGSSRKQDRVPGVPAVLKVPKSSTCKGLLNNPEHPEHDQGFPRSEPVFTECHDQTEVARVWAISGFTSRTTVRDH